MEPSTPAGDGASTLLRAAPGLARVAVTSTWRIMGWSVARSVDLTQDLVRGAASGQPPAQLVQQGVVGLRTVARQALGLPPLHETAATNARGAPAGAGANGHTGLTAAQLRARGAELLTASASIGQDDAIHPAYGRILDELAPDEARILRLLATEGTQPSVDVRTARPLGIGSELVASGLSMIGLRAGVRTAARTKAYLDNLSRLGLIWFAHEPLEDPSRYQVVEVQPEVTDALKRAGRTGKTVRRSIVLTPFGEDFCRLCLPLDTNGAETGG